MANPSWPSGLPTPIVDGSNYTWAFDNVGRSQFSTSFKERRRVSYVPEVLAFRLAMTRAEAKTLIDFAVITLKDLGRFDWIEFRDPACGLATYSFRQRPTLSPSNTFRVLIAEVSLTLWTPFDGSFALADEDDIPLQTDNGESLTT